MDINKAVEEYQCPGCVSGPAPECFEPDDSGIGCKKHYQGTIMSGIGEIFLGMPKGFNRLGFQKELTITIFRNQLEQNTQWSYDKFNVPVWKYQNGKKHIFIRGFIPRLNQSFLHIILDGDFSTIDGTVLTEKDLNEMD